MCINKESHTYPDFSGHVSLSLFINIPNLVVPMVFVIHTWYDAVPCIISTHTTIVH